MAQHAIPNPAEVGYRYRELVGGLMQVRNEIQDRKPVPEVIVVFDGLTDLQKATMIELLKNPNLEFKITGIDAPNGVDILLHIRNKA